jgi:glycosyltransferase involved in cell wall biosynthesis
MNAPISLLVPCYNAARYLPRLMESVRAQTKPFAEIIAYDDGSDDDTAEAGRRLGMNVIRGAANHGPGYARNRLLESSASEWVHFHDADDLLRPLFVERMSALLTADADVAVCDMDWLFEATGKLEIPWRYDGDNLRQDPIAATLTNPVSVGASVFRRESLVRIGGFDESLPTWEDADLQVRLANAGARFRVLPEVLSISLRHGFGASASATELSRCRLRTLEAYEHSLPARHRAVVAAEAEKLASHLLADRRLPEVAERCLALCRRLGWRVPTSRNPAIRAMRVFLPARWLLTWQSRYRRRQANRGRLR